MRFAWKTRELTHASRLDDPLFTVLGLVTFTADGYTYQITPPFQHDFATAPWFVRWFIGKMGIHSFASVAHDGGYQHNVGNALVFRQTLGYGEPVGIVKDIRGDGEGGQLAEIELAPGTVPGWERIEHGTMSREWWDLVWFHGFIAAIEEYPRAGRLKKAVWKLQAHLGYWSIRAFGGSYWRT